MLSLCTLFQFCSKWSALKNHIRSLTLSSKPPAMLSMVASWYTSSAVGGHCVETTSHALLKVCKYDCTNANRSSSSCSTSSCCSFGSSMRARFPAEPVSKSSQRSRKEWTFSPVFSTVGGGSTPNVMACRRRESGLQARKKRGRLGREGKVTKNSNSCPAS